MRTTRHTFFCLAMILLTALTTASCEKWRKKKEVDPERVFILYSAGFSNLSPSLTEDIQDLLSGDIPAKNSADVVLVISRKTSDASGRDYVKETAPYLFRVYRTKSKAVCDTLFALPAGSSLADADNMRTMLSKAAELFPVKHYGMVLSSHATGWVPAGYYASPNMYRSSSGPLRSSRIPTVDPPGMDEPGFILTKALGPEYYNNGGIRYAHEMDIEALASAIPFRLDYLLFDACLMGGVEVAYELRNVAGLIGFSQAETLSDGFDYRKMAGHLTGSPDPEAVCRDFYEQYAGRSGNYKSATVSLVNTAGLDRLASACKPLFEKYRSAIASLDRNNVQGFGGTKHWYYDLVDVLEQAGATAGELASVRSALQSCIEYAAHTGQYYSMYGGLYPIDAFCGLSMYLPSAGSSYLDNFYRDIPWNQAAGLVK